MIASKKNKGAALTEYVCTNAKIRKRSTMVFEAKSSGQLIFLMEERKILLKKRAKPQINPRTKRSRRRGIKGSDKSKEKMRERR